MLDVFRELHAEDCVRFHCIKASYLELPRGKNQHSCGFVVVRSEKV